MKRLLLACCLVAASGTVVMAQNKAAVTSQDQKVDPKLMFASKVNELEANITRKDEQTAKSTYMQLAGMMQTRIAEKQKAYDAATSDAQRKELAKQKKEQEQLYMDTKNLYPTIGTNGTEMVKKMRAFLNVF